MHDILVSLLVSRERRNIRAVSWEFYVQYKSEHRKVLWAGDNFGWSEEVFIHLSNITDIYLIFSSRWWTSLNMVIS